MMTEFYLQSSKSLFFAHQIKNAPFVVIATGLRGAATLELRAAACGQISEDQSTLARGAELPIQTPDGNILLNLINSIAQMRVFWLLLIH